tara:strand:- start:673 stop:1011 length:339 start_codon:yes stop_codon:yes gene_type:complete
MSMGALVSGVLMLAACAAPLAGLTPRDQLLIACDGMATTMGIVRNYILDGTIRHPETLAGLRDASFVVEESCREEQDPAGALTRLAAHSSILLEARLAAEAETKRGEGATWK